MMDCEKRLERRATMVSGGNWIDVFGCEVHGFCTLHSRGLLKTDGAPLASCHDCRERVSAVSRAFQGIFANRGWGDGESVSGPGSSLDATASIRERLPSLWRSLGIRSVLDIPCGDHHWMGAADLSDIEYTGGDIVPELIDRCRDGWPGRQFLQLDVTTDSLPRSDLVFCRDCLVHLPHADVWQALERMVASGAQWLMMTHFPGRKNHDISVGQWRPLDMCAAPFNLPAPKAIVNEGCREGGGEFSDKSLGLWPASDVAEVLRSRTIPRLTVGMACYRDWPGVWATVQSLRLNHRECLDEIEIIVIDNDPAGTPHSGGESSHSSKCRQLCERIGAKYEHFTQRVGTAAAKGRIFELATAPAVLVVDCHVLLPSGVLRRLIDWFQSHPTSRDLWQGPCIGDGGLDDLVGTHFAPGWGSLMYGKWAVDARAVYSEEPFEIPMQGCGMFACRKDVWPGFHSLLRGFGPEEFHLHQRFRRAGGKCYCLPWMKWCHRFGNPSGAAPPGMNADERLRGHLITHLDTGAPSIEEIRRHFVVESNSLTNEQFDRVLRETSQEFESSVEHARQPCQRG